ncbi:MAG: transposase [Nanoarchaeota archaeon]|nr:transposase [Nanoarchaeota archaeon]
MHTFGKDLKFHPHLHLIAAEGYFSDNTFIPEPIFFKSKFNKMWRAVVLNKLGVSLENYHYGFYVWCDHKSTFSINYVGRYVRHPAIANSRIIVYDKNNITFFYKDNQSKKIVITKSVDDFISSLVQHIPPKQFKIIRYYGVYCRNKRRLM